METNDDDIRYNELKEKIDNVKDTVKPIIYNW